MIALLDTSDELGVCEREIGCPVGQLITPLTGRTNIAVRENRPWAMDNGAFARFDSARFRSILKRELPRCESCLFVAMPDVVGSARRTLEVWKHWDGDLRAWSKALVLQDGIEDFDLPWHDMDAVFVGGTDRFKTSQSAKDVVRAARILGKHVHVGRVNTWERFDAWRDDADTFDGSGFGRFSHMRHSLRAMLTGCGPLFQELPEEDVT